ncbi:MAG: sigma-70 family RNA polymerase sigma factor [Actinobacteria bacterium]|nr:sigma-70 family RNA polymerase sigma factor [Actinomycetota bacterium]
MAVRADDVDLKRDRSLVELCQAGDQNAFADLYNRYYQRLLRFCTRRVGDVHEAEEITQEAFARAFSAMPRFAGERRFYPWLTVIASRLCIDSHRRVARTEPSAEIDLGGVEGGQQQILDNVDLAYLSQAIEQLGPRHREVLDLRETRGWSYQEIADHYNVTMGTVEALLFRARKALRREFLAIAGEERLAAVPFLGLALRGAQAVRARFHDLHNNLLPLAAIGAASVAAVAGGLALAPSRSPIAENAPHTARLAQTPASVGVVAPQASLESAPSLVILQKPGAGPTAPSSLTVVGGSAAEGRARTENDPSSITVAGFTVSTDFADPQSLLGILDR